ncbi:hypothetical protein ACOME3_009924 [Neoechinorhynchus agilis]
MDMDSVIRRMVDDLLNLVNRRIPDHNRERLQRHMRVVDAAVHTMRILTAQVDRIQRRQVANGHIGNNPEDLSNSKSGRRPNDRGGSTIDGRSVLNGLSSSSRRVDINLRHDNASTAGGTSYGGNPPLDLSRIAGFNHNDMTVAQLCAALLAQNQHNSANAPISMPFNRTETAVAAAVLSMAAGLDQNQQNALRNNPLAFASLQSHHISPMRRSERALEDIMQVLLQNADAMSTIGPQLGMVTPNVVNNDHAAVIGLEIVNEFLAAQDQPHTYRPRQHSTRVPLQCPQCQTFITPMWFPFNGSYLCTSCAHSVLWSVVEPTLNALTQRFMDTNDDGDDGNSQPRAPPTPPSQESHIDLSVNYTAPPIPTSDQIRALRRHTLTDHPSQIPGILQLNAVPQNHQLSSVIAALTSTFESTVLANINNPITQQIQRQSNISTPAATMPPTSVASTNLRNSPQNVNGEINPPMLHANQIGPQNLHSLLSHLLSYLNPLMHQHLASGTNAPVNTTNELPANSTTALATAAAAAMIGQQHIQNLITNITSTNNRRNATIAAAAAVGDELAAPITAGSQGSNAANPGNLPALVVNGTSGTFNTTGATNRSGNGRQRVAISRHRESRRGRS